jgi:hypothetical protein
MEWLSENWFGVLGFLVGIISTGLTIYFALTGKRDKVPYYMMSSINHFQLLSVVVPKVGPHPNSWVILRLHPSIHPSHSPRREGVL